VTCLDDFKAGKVAMAVDGNWQLSGFSDVKFKWDTAPYPQIGAQKAVWGAAEVITIPKQTKKDEKKAAAVKDFLTWLAQNSADWAKSGQIPANKASYNSMTKLPGIDAYIAELDYVKFLPAHPPGHEDLLQRGPQPDPHLRPGHGPQRQARLDDRPQAAGRHQRDPEEVARASGRGSSIAKPPAPGRQE